MLNSSLVGEAPKKPGFVLDRCFVCKSHIIDQSQDGVTCGKQSCRDGLPLLLKDINDAVSEERIDDLEYDLKEAKATINDLKKQLKKEIINKRELVGSLNLLLESKFLREAKDFENQVERIVGKVNAFIREIKDELE